MNERPTVIKTPRLTLRPIVDGDKQALIPLMKNETVSKTYMTPVFTSAEQEDRFFLRIKQLSADASRFVYAADLDGMLIGFLNDVEINGSEIELGFALDPEHHNKGFATEMLKSAMDALAGMGFDCVITGAFEENLPSIRVMEKCGMTRLDGSPEIEYQGKIHRCVMFEKRWAK